MGYKGGVVTAMPNGGSGDRYSAEPGQTLNHNPS
jgi:hypothetical protein